MKLVRKLEEKSLSSSKWFIYKLSQDEQRKYGGKFALSQGGFSEYAIKSIGTDKLLSELRDFCYEGFFETEKEAYFQVMLVFMQEKIEILERGISDLTGSVGKLKTPEWH